MQAAVTEIEIGIGKGNGDSQLCNLIMKTAREKAFERSRRRNKRFEDVGLKKGHDSTKVGIFIDASWCLRITGIGCPVIGPNS